VSESLTRLTTALSRSYRIERQLGQGGMATVYLAQDLKHDRKVAVKVLRPELAAVIGAERFVVEIKTTAALQYPHILPLFDSGTADGFLYYVMPFIDGETLRAKLDRETQLGIDESVKITTAVADALDYAHRHGVIHRDIKPENILLHDGRPMVADFGIALALSAAAGGRMTETGMSLGTPHYMSPEQATAEKEITARSDVYSLGSVLYEMLTGNPPHTGASAQQIIMKIVTEEAAPVTRLRKAIPPNVAAAVAQSLEKLPADRFVSARAFADALQNPAFRHGEAATAGAAPLQGRARWHDPVTLALGGCAVAAAAIAGWALFRPAPSGPVGRYAIQLDSTARLAYIGGGTPGRIALTPDGQNVIYLGENLAAGPIADFQLFLRPLQSLDSRPLPGTQGALQPAVSPDGSLVAFVAGENGNLLVVVPLAGGPSLQLADSAIASGPAWGPDGFVYFLTPSGSIRRVAGAGGPVENVVELPAAAAGTAYEWLTILPDGRGALVGQRPTGFTDESAAYQLHPVDLASGRMGATLPGAAARFVAETKTLLVLMADGSLSAVPFDASAREVRGRPRVLFAGVSLRFGESDLDAAGGTLVYATEGRSGTEFVAWVNRDGGPPQAVDSAWADVEFESFSLSPEGNRLAITILGGGTRTALTPISRSDIWIKQLDRGPLSRLTLGGEGNFDPAWSPDGRYVSYVSLRGGRRTLWRRRADGVGAEEPVADAGRDIIEARWSQDGAWLVASVEGSASLDIMVMQVGVDSVLRPLLAEPTDEWKPSLSPDGRRLAYLSRESGVPQVYVRPFPDVQGGKWQLSLDGGTDPLWGADGRELFWRSLDGDTVVVAEMTGDPAGTRRRKLAHAPPMARFEVNGSDRMFEVSRDGRRFLFSIQRDRDQSGDLVIVQNFITELRAAIAGGGAR